MKSNFKLLNLFNNEFDEGKIYKKNTNLLLIIIIEGGMKNN